jgi:bacterioferritin
MEASEAVQEIQDVREMLERAAAMEAQSAKEYNEWANESGANADSATKRLFEDLVADEESHNDQYTTEMENIERFGEGYLALQSIERSKGLSAGTGAE